MSDKVYDIFGDNLKAGCWYETEGGKRCFCIGYSSDDKIFVELSDGDIEESDEIHYRALPECDGWEWEESADYPLQGSELEPGEWYESDLGFRCFCIGFSVEGQCQIQLQKNVNAYGATGTAAHDRTYRHLPDCDDWDWDDKPEVVELTEENAQDWPRRHMFAHKSAPADSAWNLIMANEDEITKERINNPHSAYLAVYPSMLDGFAGSK